MPKITANDPLVGALVMGLWNRLTAHQDRKHPFRLTRFDVPETQKGSNTSLGCDGRRSTASSTDCSGRLR